MARREALERRTSERVRVRLRNEGNAKPATPLFRVLRALRAMPFSQPDENACIHKTITSTTTRTIGRTLVARQFAEGSLDVEVMPELRCDYSRQSQL
jgi:hypothetical protein